MEQNIRMERTVHNDCISLGFGFYMQSESIDTADTLAQGIMLRRNKGFFKGGLLKRIQTLDFESS